MTITWLSHELIPVTNVNIYMYLVTVYLYLCAHDYHMTMYWHSYAVLVSCIVVCTWRSHDHHVTMYWCSYVGTCVGTWNTVGQWREVPRETLSSARSLTRLKVLYTFLDLPKGWVTFILWPLTPLLNLLRTPSNYNVPMLVSRCTKW